MAPNDYEFTADWFSTVEPTWRALFQQFLPSAKKVLEIGSFEGRSAVWLIKNAFRPTETGDVYCVDTWEGSMEHVKEAMPLVQARFDRNVTNATADAPGINVHKIRDKSLSALVRLLAEGHGSSFDFIYIDGSHEAADVLNDLVLSFALCRIGGLIACDDYLWNFGQNPLLTPKLAIDSFVNCYSSKLSPISGAPLHQFFFRKNAA
jgi:predicted O-methyltransferase YrrM